MFYPAQQARLDEISADVQKMMKNPNLSDKQVRHLNRLIDEGQELLAERDTYQKAVSMSSYGSPGEYGMSGVNPGQSGYPFASHVSKSVIDDPREQKAAEHGLAARKHVAPSMFHTTDKQMRDLYAAGRSNMSFGFTVGKGAEGNMNSIDKTVSEGSVGSLLPPILLPNAFQLRLEPVRIAEFFPAIATEGQSVTFLQNSGNALATSGEGMSVAENEPKPELGMTLEATTIPFSVVAAVETVSKQLWGDFESVAEFIPAAISNQVIQGENYQILSGSGTAPDQTGLLNVSGIQTRAFTTGGSDTEIDTILEAANDVRVGTAFAAADLVILNPSDWLSLRRIKTSFNSYVLRQDDPGELGGIDHLFQLRVASTTSMPQGEALVLDSRIAVNVFRRWGLTVEVNPWAGTEFVQNQLIIRAETRLGVGCIYPKAVTKVTGLFPSS